MKLFAKLGIEPESIEVADDEFSATVRPLENTETPLFYNVAS
jgi:hypothetical protein